MSLLKKAATLSLFLVAIFLVVEQSYRVYFIGPMAKQHRMAVLTLGCVGAAVEIANGREPHLLAAAVALVIVGALATAVIRTRKILEYLEQRTEVSE